MAARTTVTRTFDRPEIATVLGPIRTELTAELTVTFAPGEERAALSVVARLYLEAARELEELAR